MPSNQLCKLPRPILDKTGSDAGSEVMAVNAKSSHPANELAAQATVKYKSKRFESILVKTKTNKLVNTNNPA